MTVTQKLSLSLFLFICIVLSITLAAAAWSFSAGFNHFIVQLEQERLSRISASVIQQYEERNFSLNNISIDLLLTEPSSPRQRGFPPRGARPMHPPGNRPPPNRSFREPPNSLPAPHSVEPIQDNIGARRPPIMPPTGLFSVNGGFLVGQNSEQTPLVVYPIVYQGQKIAELRSWSARTSTQELANAFSTKHQQMLVIIGFTCLLATGILSWFLAKLLFAPTKQIINTVKELTDGKYDVVSEYQQNDELGALSKHINTLASTLKQNQHSKRQFFADLSHELRTPLTILQGELELLETGVRPASPENLQSLQDEIKLLDGLIKDIHDFALTDIGALHYSMEPLDLSSLCDKVLKHMQVIAAEKNILLSGAIQSNIVFKADKKRIEQMLNNLMINSIQYTDGPGKIFVKLKNKNNAISLVVEDSAPTIDSDNIEHILQPLFRLDSARNRRSEGAGLGLSICANIVKAHQGSIKVSQSDFGGVKISIHFPLGV